MKSNQMTTQARDCIKAEIKSHGSRKAMCEYHKLNDLTIAKIVNGNTNGLQKNTYKILCDKIPGFKLAMEEEFSIPKTYNISFIRDRYCQYLDTIKDYDNNFVITDSTPNIKPERVLAFIKGAALSEIELAQLVIIANVSDSGICEDTLAAAKILTHISTCTYSDGEIFYGCPHGADLVIPGGYSEPDPSQDIETVKDITRLTFLRKFNPKYFPAGRSAISALPANFAFLDNCDKHNDPIITRATFTKLTNEYTLEDGSKKSYRNDNDYVVIATREYSSDPEGIMSQIGAQV